jgi:hypothetical protein
MNRHPNVTLVAEVLATFVLTFGPIALAIGEIARLGS